MAERYRTIVADPPWRYGYRPSDRGPGRGASAEHYYPTLSNDALAEEIPVSAMAADSAHLFVWVTNPVLTEQHCGHDGLSVADLILRWEFEPKALLTWVKTTKDGAVSRGGTGWYWRGATEHVVHAVRGGAGIPSGQRLPNVFFAPRGEHSRKPDVFMDMVERICPGPYLELFARRERLGWDSWGDESLGTAEMPEAAA
jgi:N6-adenosine-specific RNA methylase IME4